MKTSAAGRALIAQREGRRLVAYRDTKGILTIGAGHTGRMSSPPVTTGMTITEAQCDEFLAADLAPVEAVLNSAVKVPVTQTEFDAMASLGFNIGAAGLKHASVIKKLNRGDVAGAAEAFLMWDRPGGLSARREREKAQFLAPGTPDETATARAQSVASARAATLATRAEAARAKAHAAQAGATALIVASATAAMTTHAQHPSAAWWAGLLVLAAGLCVALVAVLGHRTARTLTTNAGLQRPASQAVPVGNAGIASKDLIETLKP